MDVMSAVCKGLFFKVIPCWLLSGADGESSMTISFLKITFYVFFWKREFSRSCLIYLFIQYYIMILQNLNKNIIFLNLLDTKLEALFSQLDFAINGNLSIKNILIQIL